MTDTLTTTAACKRCSRTRVMKARGLCEPCYRTPGVKENFPAYGRRATPQPAHHCTKEVWTDIAPYVPTPETSPAAIAADQRAVVRECRRKLGQSATVEAISDAVSLPVSVVRKRIAELTQTSQESKR